MRSVQVDFDARLYDATSLREAARAFAEHARITVRRRGERYVARIEPLYAPPPPDLADEFGNYALALAIRRARAPR